MTAWPRRARRDPFSCLFERKKRKVLETALSEIRKIPLSFPFQNSRLRTLSTLRRFLRALYAAKVANDERVALRFGGRRATCGATL